MLTRAVYAAHLVERIINPIGDLVRRRLIGRHIGADEIFKGAGAAVRAGENMVNIPSAIDEFPMIPSAVVGIAISGTAHQVPVEILGELRITELFLPEHHSSRAIDFHS